MKGASIKLPVIDHAAAAARFGADTALAAWHDATVWGARVKRDRASGTVREWEALRDSASKIKEHTLGQLDEYLEAFEARATENGIRVHWARDADEHNRIVLEILSRLGATRLVKSKSMLTEECHLNPFLEDHGIRVVDTDLGERIMQLAGEPPSHIVTPAIHVRKERIAEIFHRSLGTEAGATDPQYLTEAARRHLRDEFLAADAALTGVNFALADTGGFVVCTNEGNADLGVHLAPVHIASMGIEKLIPRAADLGIFLRLLARSATGQPITVYSSHFHRPRPGTELHIVLVDNGRSVHLGREEFRSSLKCIRCGACMNTCPVFRRSGGHSYGTTVPGPIGSILAPGVDPRKYGALPFASTLCGSCTDVCPVRIDIHQQLYRWRQTLSAARVAPRSKRLASRVAARVLANPRLYRTAGRTMRRALRMLPTRLLYSRYNVWGRARELPTLPRQSFRDWYLENRRHDEQPRSDTTRDPRKQAGAGAPS
jgi:L-lactate dehydrogenase complex protein LldF